MEGSNNEIRLLSLSALILGNKEFSWELIHRKQQAPHSDNNHPGKVCEMLTILELWDWDLSLGLQSSELW